MKLGFIGMGFVGGTTEKVLGEVHETFPYDIDPNKPYTNPEVLKNAEAIFLSVPTPMLPRGDIDYSPIHNSLETLVNVTQWIEKKPLVIVRSTAVSGTTGTLQEMYKQFQFAFNPEFLVEKNALEDMKNTSRVVIGYDLDKPSIGKKVEDIYRARFPDATYVHHSLEEAEMVKYMANGMLASQIVLANEFARVCEAHGVDYNKIKDTVLLDSRIGRNLKVPGPDGHYGFGGKCFPKDIRAIIDSSRAHHYEPSLLAEVWRSNVEKFRDEKDWLDIKGAVSEKKD